MVPSVVRPFGRVARGLLLLASLLSASLAGAQVNATIGVDEARVQGLHYDGGANPGQKATWNFHSAPVTGWDPRYLRQVTWSVDGVRMKGSQITHEPDVEPPGAFDFTYTATDAGKHTVSVQVDYNDSPLPGTMTVAAIGGPLGFGVTGGQSGLGAPSHDLTPDATAEDPAKAWYLQYFGYDRSGGTVPTGCQASQYGSVVAPSQPTTGTTTYDWHLDSGLKKNSDADSASSSISAFADGSSNGSGLAVHCTFTYTDTSDTTLTGSADDDSDTTPPSGSTTVNVSAYRFSVHKPSTLTSTRTAHAVSPGPPDYRPGVADTYAMTLKDAQGVLMPSVWVAERFSGVEFPPGPTPSAFTTAGVGTGCGQFFDYLSGNSSSMTAYPKPGPDLNSFVQRYYAGTNSTTSSSTIGILVGTFNDVIWTDDTQHSSAP